MTPPHRTPQATVLMQSQQRVEDKPGHWLIARLGKRALRPGGGHYAIHDMALQSEHLNLAAATETWRRLARKTFHRHRRSITAVSLIAHLPSNEATS